MSADKKDTFGPRRLWRRLCFWLLGLLLWLSGAYFISCTAIDLGGAVDNIGKQVPVCYPFSEEAPPPSAYLNPSAYQDALEISPTSIKFPVYHKGGYHYVMLPIVYVPENHSIIDHLHLRGTSTRDWQYPEPFSPEEIRQFPVEVFYAELNDYQFRQSLRRRSLLIKRPNKNYPFTHFRIIPADEIHLEGAECTLETIHPFKILCRKLPARTTSLHQCLTPLSWIAEVADVPLSILATPVGWVYDLATFPMSREHR